MTCVICVICVTCVICVNYVPSVLVCCLCFSILKKQASVYFREFSIKQNCVVASSAKAKSLDIYNRIYEIACGENTVIVRETNNTE